MNEPIDIDDALPPDEQVYYDDIARRLYPDRIWTSTSSHRYSALFAHDDLPLPSRDELRAAATTLPPVFVWSRDAFFDRLEAVIGPSGITAISRAAQTDDDVCFVYEKFQSRTELRSDSASLQAGLALLVARELMTEAHVAALLTGV